MVYKKIKLFFIIYMTIVVNSRTITLVIDTTISYRNELTYMKRNAVSLIKNLKNISSIDNYMLLPFNDPDIGDGIASSTPEDLLDDLIALPSLTEMFIIDCPEPVLSSIEKALEISGQKSFIFVFTDAFTKDSEKIKVIEQLCRTTQSQVFMFLSGICDPEELKNGISFDVYYDVARACNGNIFSLDYRSPEIMLFIRKAFEFMTEVATKDWSEIKTELFFKGTKEINFSVNSFTMDVIITVTGENTNLQITDELGNSPRIQEIVNMTHSKIFRILDLEAKNYKCSASTGGRTLLRIYTKFFFPFKLGFSPRRPQSIRETSPTPLPNSMSYVLIEVPEEMGLELEYIDVLDDDMTKRLVLAKLDSKSNIYIVETYFRSTIRYVIIVFGKYTISNEEFSTSSEIFQAQSEVSGFDFAPTIEILEPDNNFVEYKSNVTIPCKVNGYPTPTIWFEDENGKELSSESFKIQIPSIYMSYAVIESFNKNSTISCKAKNTVDEESTSIELYVNRKFTFEVIKSPEDSTFEYGSEGKLYCDIDAYPDAAIKWYHNDSAVEVSDSLEIEERGKVLIIKSMSLDDIGKYKCEASNDMETKELTANVDISGLEAPKVDVAKPEVNAHRGDYIRIECRITKGKPFPEVTWKYKSFDGYTFGDLPDDVKVDGVYLIISHIKSSHKGYYKCEAVNNEGSDSREVAIKMEFAPIIKNSEGINLNVPEEDQVELQCEVEASPVAKVRWEMYRVNGVRVTDFTKHTTDSFNTLRFTAMSDDSGTYYCIAENPAGTAEKIYKVNVLVEPYIKPVQMAHIKRIGSSITLHCDVIYGNPEPHTTWEFIPSPSRAIPLISGQSSLDYTIDKISKANEGTYRCSTQNERGHDSIEINLTVVFD